MKHALNLRALACAALATFASTTFAGGYSVLEPAARPVVPNGDFTYSEATAMARDGRMLITAVTFTDVTAYGGGEICSAAGDTCRRLAPKGLESLYTAASSDFKRVAGYAKDEHGSEWAVRVSDGVPEYLIQGGRANSINKHNVVVGEDAAGHSYRYGASKEPLPALVGPFSYANSINDSGVCVGEGSTADGESRAVMWNKLGEIRPLQPKVPDGKGHHALASFVTANGVAYGLSTYHDRGFVKHAVRFTKSGKGAVSLGALGNLESGNTSYAHRANSLGAVVGYSTNLPADGNPQAVLFVNGEVIELATQVPAAARAKYQFAYGVAINDAGQILVAAYRRDNGNPVALRLDPQP